MLQLWLSSNGKWSLYRTNQILCQNEMWIESDYKCMAQILNLAIWWLLWMWHWLIISKCFLAGISILKSFNFSDSEYLDGGIRFASTLSVWTANLNQIDISTPFFIKQTYPALMLIKQAYPLSSVNVNQIDKINKHQYNPTIHQKSNTICEVYFFNFDIRHY